MINFGGILPAVVTPLDQKGRLSESSFRQLLSFLYEHPIDGIYVGGQTGEGLFLSVEDRKRLTELALEHSPAGKTVIVHVGATRLEEAIDLSRHAADAGVHAVSSLPPAGPYSFGDILNYYRGLTSAVDVPFFVYHFSEYSQAITSSQQLLDLCSLPNVVGAKFTDYDLYTLSALKAENHTIFYGRDEMLSAGLLYGADGGIGTFYNLIPKHFTDIYSLGKQGQWHATTDLQSEVQQLIRLCSKVPMLSAVKTILGWMGIPCGPCLAPRRTLTHAEEQTLRTALDASGLNRILPLSLAR